MDDILCYFITLTIDGLVTLYFSIEYLSAQKILTSYLESLAKGINRVDEDGEVPQYVVVRGNVKAIGPPIKSLKKSFTTGVIQKLTVKEFVAEKTCFGFWVNHEKLINEKYSMVPFELRDDKFKISITSALDAHYLDLEVIEDRFEPAVSNLLGFLFGIQSKGMLHTEYLLQENSIVTGFGEVVKESDGSMRLIPPKNGMRYILTTMDPETLTSKLISMKKYYSFCCFIFSVLGIAVASVLTFQLWKNYSRKKKINKMNEQIKRIRLERKMNNSTAEEPLNESFTCIICCIRPREMVLLPCGHISMCAECSYQCMNRPCPVCRQYVTDTNLIFIS